MAIPIKLILTQEEANELDRRAATQIHAVRPTVPSFAWAKPFLTIGVTGTNGKTSTTHMIASVVRSIGHSVMLATTLDYRLDDMLLDVPRSTTRGFFSAMQHSAQAGCRHAVLEVTSQALAAGYAKLWRFDHGVFTNLTRDHFDAHGSWEHYLASKAQLFVHLAPGRTAVLNACDSASLLLDKVTPPDVKRMWFGDASRGEVLHKPDLFVEHLELSSSGTLIKLAPSELAEQLGGELRINLVGRVFAENALAAACATLSAGIEASHVREGLNRCPGVPGRFEILATSPIVAIDYAHTPDALQRLCESARELARGAKVIVVFGAGGQRDAHKREPMGRAVGKGADVAIVTNDNPRTEDPKVIAKVLSGAARRGGRAHVIVELDRRKAIERAIEQARPTDVVVVAGKGHEQGQTIGKETLPFSDQEEVRRILGLPAAHGVAMG